MGLTKNGICKEAVNSRKNLQVTTGQLPIWGGGLQVWEWVEARHRWGDIAGQSGNQLSLRQQCEMGGHLGI